MRKQTNHLEGLKYILAGLALMTISTVAVQLVSLYDRIFIVQCADVAIHLLGWIMIFLGVQSVRNIRVEFKKNYLFALIGIIATILEVFFVIKEVRAGLKDMAFIDMGVMFMAYVSNLAMLAVYFFAMKGMGQLIAKNGDIHTGVKSTRLAKKGIIIVLASFILVPLAYVFPLVIKYILALGGILIGAFIQFAMINYVNQGYRKLN